MKIRKSISGEINTYNNTPVVCNSRKQAVTMLPRCDADYIAGTNAVQQTTWFRRMVSFLHVSLILIIVHLDHLFAFRKGNKTAGKRRRKLTYVKYNCLREHQKRKNITIWHILTVAIREDVIKKPLKKEEFAHLRSTLRMG